MSKEQRRDIWWAGLIVFASALSAACTYGYWHEFFS
jgi:hypothetical protein